jgi:hypothetical protein
LSQVRVRYDNGLTITANSSTNEVRAGKHVLPKFGWLAEGAGVTAWTALCDGVVADFAETAGSVFVNARPAADWNLTGIRQVRPEVVQFEQTEPGMVRVSYQWRVNEAITNDYHCFVHFGDGDEQIRFQQDHGLATPTSQWKIGETITDGPHLLRVTGDGDYGWFIGLWAPQGGGRVALEGVDDGHHRIRLGVLQVRDGGKSIRFEPEHTTSDDRRNAYREHLNIDGHVVDFGPVRTDGSVLVRREGDEWVLQTWPREMKFLVELSAQRFGLPVSVRCVGGAAATKPVAVGGERWRLPLTGATQYRWR